MGTKNGMRRVYEDDLVDGVVIPIPIFVELTVLMPPALRESLLAEFEQQDGIGYVRIERSAWSLLTWFML
jgi:hypothetical protein